jgi:uncharacterized protein (DUF58 family)
MGRGADFPDRPPLPSATHIERRLATLGLDPLRRLDGLLQGEYRGLALGSGAEPAESRLYTVGDDLRRMDWRLTARTTRPHVRNTVADRELEVWVLVDDSPSLRFGTTQALKWELACGVVATIALLTARSANRVGALTFGGGPVQRFPAEAGRQAATMLLARLNHSARIDQISHPASSLADALTIVPNVAKQRGTVVIVSDFMAEDDSWVRPLRALSQRHDLLAFEIVDPRELELPAVGVVTLVDPESGRARQVQSSSRRVRNEFSRRSAEARAQVNTGLRHASAQHVVLSTDRDWVVEIARYVARRRRLAVAGAHR